METKKQKIGNWFRTSISARMLVVGFIFLILLIPLGFVKDLIRERETRQVEVIEEINEKWGNEVILNGPIIKVPYKTYTEEKIFDEKTKTFMKNYKEVLNHAYLLPKTLDINSNVNTKQLERGIYETVVYSSDITMEGTFSEFDFSTTDIPKEDIDWEKATLLLQTSNLKGIRNEIRISMNQKDHTLKPKFDEAYMSTLESGFIKDQLKGNGDSNFSLKIKINGSEALRFVPVGAETSVSMYSDWHSPSFNGNYLPNDETKKITNQGFEAHWTVLETNRQFGQQFFNNLPNLNKFAFGTSLIIPIDDYQKTERTSKYGILIIGLTLLVFLLIQIISKIPIHPFQYFMIGLALVMFYTLLISISEHQNFLLAYFIAGIAVVGLITAYSKTILKNKKFPLLVLGSLSALYAFIFVIIQLENYALLVGSIGLFIILAIVMFTSKRIDWTNQ
ncbi:cell envelope integrity protein CreD [Maribacter sp. ANRC-HE7]|uniref:Cell envelope integrity protein CreD n=1 Tax=Maribacter aquimaris TaxID=2737171 RepID=A0ABR7V316_9FLAO|nr:cell envelope integrity protein CreD [Maribacter aquimaris]MBD0778081.1 cell envelope integrity protein CreD [Maribacter aquimaris]